VSILKIINCICGNKLELLNYRLIELNGMLIYREYFSICTCSNVVLVEDLREEDQIYLDCPDLLKYSMFGGLE